MSFLLEFPIAVAIGAAHWDPESGESIERVLNRADQAMYEEKRKSSPP